MGAGRASQSLLQDAEKGQGEGAREEMMVNTIIHMQIILRISVC